MQAYCMKCRAKKEIKDAKSITMKNGKPATWKGLGLLEHSLTELRKAGCSHYRDVQPFILRITLNKQLYN